MCLYHADLDLCIAKSRNSLEMANVRQTRGRKERYTFSCFLKWAHKIHSTAIFWNIPCRHQNRVLWIWSSVKTFRSIRFVHAGASKTHHEMLSARSGTVPARQNEVSKRCAWCAMYDRYGCGSVGYEQALMPEAQDTQGLSYEYVQKS